MAKRRAAKRFAIGIVPSRPNGGIDHTAFMDDSLLGSLKSKVSNLVRQSTSNSAPEEVVEEVVATPIDKLEVVVRARQGSIEEASGADPDASPQDMQEHVLLPEFKELRASLKELAQYEIPDSCNRFLKAIEVYMGDFARICAPSALDHSDVNAWVKFLASQSADKLQKMSVCMDAIFHLDMLLKDHMNSLEPLSSEPATPWTPTMNQCMQRVAGFSLFLADVGEELGISIIEKFDEAFSKRRKGLNVMKVKIQARRAEIKEMASASAHSAKDTSTDVRATSSNTKGTSSDSSATSYKPAIRPGAELSATTGQGRGSANADEPAANTQFKDPTKIGKTSTRSVQYNIGSSETYVEPCSAAMDKTTTGSVDGGQSKCVPDPASAGSKAGELLSRKKQMLMTTAIHGGRSAVDSDFGLSETQQQGEWDARKGVSMANATEGGLSAAENQISRKNRLMTTGTHGGRSATDSDLGSSESQLQEFLDARQDGSMTNTTEGGLSATGTDLGVSENQFDEVHCRTKNRLMATASHGARGAADYSDFGLSESQHQQLLDARKDRSMNNTTDDGLSAAGTDMGVPEKQVQETLSRKKDTLMTNATHGGRSAADSDFGLSESQHQESLDARNGVSMANATGGGLSPAENQDDVIISRKTVDARKDGSVTNAIERGLSAAGSNLGVSEKQVEETLSRHREQVADQLQEPKQAPLSPKQVMQDYGKRKSYDEFIEYLKSSKEHHKADSHEIAYAMKGAQVDRGNDRTNSDTNVVHAGSQDSSRRSSKTTRDSSLSSAQHTSAQELPCGQAASQPLPNPRGRSHVRQISLKLSPGGTQPEGINAGKPRRSQARHTLIIGSTLPRLQIPTTTPQLQVGTGSPAPSNPSPDPSSSKTPGHWATSENAPKSSRASVAHAPKQTPLIGPRMLRLPKPSANTGLPDLLGKRRSAVDARSEKKANEDEVNPYSTFLLSGGLLV